MRKRSLLKKLILTAQIATICLICCIKLNAQTADSMRVIIENGWIEKMSDKIAFDVSLNNAYETFEVKTNDNKIILYPNTPRNLRFKLNYRFISLGFQIAPNFIPGNGQEDLKGKTKSFGLGATFILKHSFFEISYSKVKGYYLLNTSDYDNTWVKGDPYIQFPDLNYKGFAISSGYYNNSKFSLRSLTSQTERQLKSAGSFIPVFNFRYYTMDDKSSGPNKQNTKNIESSIGPGYSYTFVAKEKYYFSLGLLASLGYLNTKLTTTQPTGNVNTNQDNFIFRWDAKTGIGYNGNRLYYGLYANVSGSKYKQENTVVNNFETRVFYHIFFGIRIKSPDYLKRQITKIEKKIP